MSMERHSTSKRRLQNCYFNTIIVFDVSRPPLRSLGWCTWDCLILFLQTPPDVLQVIWRDIGMPRAMLVIFTDEGGSSMKSPGSDQGRSCLLVLPQPEYICQKIGTDFVCVQNLLGGGIKLVPNEGCLDHSLFIQQKMLCQRAIRTQQLNSVGPYWHQNQCSSFLHHQKASSGSPASHQDWAHGCTALKLFSNAMYLLK